jgi:hypothetical protein
MGVDVDELSFPLHSPMACSHQTKGQSFLSDAALFHHAVVGGSAFLGGVKPPSLDIRWSVDRRVPVLPNLTWSKPFLPGHAYPMSEPSWHLCVYP